MYNILHKMGNAGSLNVDTTVTTEVNSRNITNNTTITTIINNNADKIHSREDAINILNNEGPRWTPGQSYKTGEVVTFNHQLYQCMREHNVQAPDWTPANLLGNYWSRYD